MQGNCSNCGASLNRPNAAFCAACGHKLQSNDVVARLQLHHPQHGDRVCTLSQPLTVIGRDLQSDLPIDELFVSRRHAQVEQIGLAYWVSDLGSTNGITVNGLATASQQLCSGDIIRIGDLQGNSVSLTFSDSQKDSTPFYGTSRLGVTALGSQSTLLIGRDPASQLHLDHPAVSRRHAQVKLTKHGHVIRDLGSANRTFVNGQMLNSSHTLSIGDVVQVGPFKLIFEAGGLAHYSAEGNYRIDAVKLVREVPDRQNGRKRILNDISLTIEPREFIALVGGSGAGKSTLMKALSGFAPAEGQVLVNGENLYNNFSSFRSILGYVPQDDIIHRHLTVRSALNYAAQLRLPDATKGEINQRIGQVIKEVELSQHVDKQVLALSGGQRKRVSIAVELLAQPGLFYLDEPTSGLDPGLEKKMMYNMRQLADAGRTIVLVTHATANIDQCTHVAFLGYGGRLAWFGPPQEAQAHFGTTDFADIYTQLSEETPIDESLLPAQWQGQYQQMTARGNGQATCTPSEFWAHCYRQSSYYDRYVTQRQQQIPPSPVGTSVDQTISPEKQRADLIKQFSVLMRRYFELLIRDRISMGILLAVMPVIALLVLLITKPTDLRGLPIGDETECRSGQTTDNAATIYEYVQCAVEDAKRRNDDPYQGLYSVVGDTQRVLFIMALAPTLLGIFAASNEIVKEAAIYQRERLVNLKIWPYLLSKTAVLAGFGLVQCGLFLLVISSKIDLPRDGVLLPPLIEIFVTLMLGTIASISLGLLISAIVRSQNMVIYIILLVLFVQIMFAGAIFKITPGVRPLSYLTITRWTLEGLGATADMERLKDIGGGCIEGEDVEDIPESRRLPKGDGYCFDGQQYLPPSYTFHINYDDSAGHLMRVWFTLILFAVALHGGTYYLQKRKDII